MHDSSDLNFVVFARLGEMHNIGEIYTTLSLVNFGGCLLFYTADEYMGLVMILETIITVETDETGE